MKPESLVPGYNFVESMLLDLTHENRLRTVVLTLDYDWEIPDRKPRNERPWQPVLVKLQGCRKFLYEAQTGFVENHLTPPDPVLTVISWGDATEFPTWKDLCLDLGIAETAVYFQFTGPGGFLDLVAICRHIVVEPQF